MTTREDFIESFVSIAHLICGRKAAMTCNDAVTRKDPSLVLAKCRESIQDDVSQADPNGDRYGAILRSTSRKLEALDDLAVLASVIDEFEWDS